MTSTGFWDKWVSIQDIIEEEIINMMNDYNNGKLDEYSFSKGVGDAILNIKGHIGDRTDLKSYSLKTNNLIKEINSLEETGAFDECDYYEGFFQGCALAAKVLDMSDAFIYDLQSVVDKAASYEK